MPTPSFWAELKRRHVVRVTVEYVVVAVVVGGAADIFFPGLGLPDQALTFVLALLVFGLPIAAVLAWAFDVAPDGADRTTGDTVAATPPASFDPKAIAVLPFTNLSDDPENEFFSDGVMEDILMHLSRIEDLRVTSRTSAMTYKGLVKPIREISAELRVGTVLEGSVRRVGNRVRVVAQLIDCKTDEHLWGETYDRDLEDIFAVQSDVSRKIARSLRSRLAPEKWERIQRPSHGQLQNGHPVPVGPVRTSIV